MTNTPKGDLKPKPCPFCGREPREVIDGQFTCSSDRCILSTVVMHDTIWNKRYDAESRKGMLAKQEAIDFAHYLDAHEELTSDEAFDQYLTERKGRG